MSAKLRMRERYLDIGGFGGDFALIVEGPQ
jgi:hypothetical protein